MHGALPDAEIVKHSLMMIPSQFIDITTISPPNNLTNRHLKSTAPYTQKSRIIIIVIYLISFVPSVLNPS